MAGGVSRQRRARMALAMVTTRQDDVAATRPYSQAQAGAYQRGRTDQR